MEVNTNYDDVLGEIRKEAERAKAVLMDDDDVTPKSFRNVASHLNRIICDLTDRDNLSEKEPALFVSDGTLVSVGSTVYTERETKLTVEGFQYDENGWRVRCYCGDNSVMVYGPHELSTISPWDNEMVIWSAVQVGRKSGDMTEKEVKEWVADLVERARKAPDNE